LRLTRAGGESPGLVQGTARVGVAAPRAQQAEDDERRDPCRYRRVRIGEDLARVGGRVVPRASVEVEARAAAEHVEAPRVEVLLARVGESGVDERPACDRSNAGLSPFSLWESVPPLSAGSQRSVATKEDE
jgi:hypothetical protein